MSRFSNVSPRLTRRLLLGASLSSAALVPLTSGNRAAAHPGAEHLNGLQGATPTATSTSGWRTWYLTSPEELRPADPGAPTQAEIDEVIAAQAAPSDATVAAIARWGSGPAVLAWSQLAEELGIEFQVGGMTLRRFMATIHTALQDAAIAAWDAQGAIARPSPGAISNAITPAAGVDPQLPSFPSEHAAIASASATILAYLLPDVDPSRFDQLVSEATESRIAAGAAFRSDIDAGLEIGQAVAEMAIARAETGGTDAEWDPSTRLTGPGYWEPTPPAFIDPPLFPMAGTWKTWVVTSGDQVRPAPPPEYGSQIWQAELRMVQEIAANLTFEQERAAIWWGTANSGVLLGGWTRDLISKAGVSSPVAAQILADMYVAIADALVAVWDAKFTWWTARPVTADPNLVPLVPTNPYPSYPSGYSAVMGSASTVIGHYFPDAADEMSNRAWEAASSRFWAGLHYVIDDDAGLTMGRQVGRMVCALSTANPVDDA